MSDLNVNSIGPASGGTVDITGAALVTPALGTPASGTLTNCTGLPASTGLSGTTLASSVVSSSLSTITPSGGTLAITGAQTISGNVGIGGASAAAPLVVRGTTDGNMWVRAGSDAASGLTGLGISGINNAGSALCEVTLQGTYVNVVTDNILRWRFETSTGHCIPGADNAYNHGSGSLAIKQIYTVNSVIVTSDARLKTTRPYSAAEKAVAQRIKSLGLVYQWNDAIAAKGADRARLHFGVTVQSVIAAFEAEGLDPFRYGVVCYDEWGAQVIKHPAVEARAAVAAVDEVWEEELVNITIRVNGEDRPAQRTVLNLVQPAVPAQPAVQARDAYTETVREAGNRYSLRLDQLNFFMLTAGA